MIRLLRYTKPYLLFILLNIVFLFVQANADLSLPDYLSRIVNTGIQQGGIESGAPDAMRQQQMERVLIFAGGESTILDSYTLVDQNSPEYAAALKKYPALESGPIYLRKELDQTGLDALSAAMTEPLLAVYSLDQALADPQKAAAKGGGFDLSRLPPGMGLFEALGKMPADQLAQMTAQMKAGFASLDENMLEQMVVAAVRAEYEALGIDLAKIQQDYILRVGGMMLLVSLVGGAAIISSGFLAARTAAGVARDIRRDVFKKVESFSSAEFDKFSTASLITRSTNDVTQVQMVTFMIQRMVFFAPIIGIGGIIRALGAGASMWWIIAAAVLALLSLIIAVFAIALPKFKIIQSLVDRLNLVARENLSGMMVIRAFNKQNFETVRFDKANQDLTQNGLFVARVMASVFPIMMLIMNGLSLLIIWVGSRQVAEANMRVGDMMAFMQYAMQIAFSFLMLSMMFIFLPRAAVSGDRIADVLETPLAIRDPETPVQFPEPFRGRVEFRNVNFRYPGAEEDVLRSINFTAEPGQTTAIIGSTGCGKSTVINLIPRFYDVTKGAVLVDGMDVRQIRQANLRDKIGYIPQKGLLFSGTIESNLLYADKNAGPEALRQSAEIAQAMEFIEAKPEGMATEIAQGGMNVSGGQKQRLAIARALVKRPPIYIFDDSFSALDYKTDSALRRALKEKTGDATVIIVTQRVATIKNADQIIVLDEGEVVGQGKHKELLETCETYREIAFSQLSKEELA
jgi:ATP-binding cassette subfamily B protein